MQESVTFGFIPAADATTKRPHGGGYFAAPLRFARSISR